jgi:signal peptidase
MSSPLRFATRALSTAILLVAGVALVVGVLIPRLLGGTAYAVLSGSMSPTYPIGTLVVTRKADTSALQVGDVITFQIESGKPQVATHRIVATVFGHQGMQYTTKGDANEMQDLHPVLPVQIVGKVAYGIPYLGYVTAYLTAFATGNSHQIVIFSCVGLLLAYGAYQVIAKIRERGKRPDGVPAEGEEGLVPEPVFSFTAVSPHPIAQTLGPGLRDREALRGHERHR